MSDAPQVPVRAEPLEERRLLAAASLDGGVLTVSGNGRANVIHVSISSEDCIVRIRTQSDSDRSLIPLENLTAIVIRGQAGDDTITIADVNEPGQIQLPVTIIGANGNDTITGSAGNDSINGGAGDDVLDGGNGNDIVIGADDRDLIFGGAGDDYANGGRARDKLYGGNGNDSLNGGPGIDRVRGQQGDDFLVGGFEPDSLLGSQGHDDFSGPLFEIEDPDSSDDDVIL